MVAESALDIIDENVLLSAGNLVIPFAIIMFRASFRMILLVVEVKFHGPTEVSRKTSAKDAGIHQKRFPRLKMSPRQMP